MNKAETPRILIKLIAPALLVMAAGVFTSADVSEYIKRIENSSFVVAVLQKFNLGARDDHLTGSAGWGALQAIDRQQSELAERIKGCPIEPEKYGRLFPWFNQKEMLVANLDDIPNLIINPRVKEYECYEERSEKIKIYTGFNELPIPSSANNLLCIDSSGLRYTGENPKLSDNKYTYFCVEM